VRNNIIRACFNVALQHKIPVSHIAALVAVESAGNPFCTIDSSGFWSERIKEVSNVIVRLEGHVVFRRLVRQGIRPDAYVKAGLASRNMNQIEQGRQQSRWRQIDLLVNKLVNNEGWSEVKAVSFALQCASFGLGQTMGFNAVSLDYRSAYDMVHAYSMNAGNQIDGIMRYCQNNGLMKALRDGRWAAVALGYNGKRYKKYAYDTKMARMQRKYAWMDKPNAINRIQVQVEFNKEHYKTVGAKAGLVYDDNKNVVTNIRKWQTQINSLGVYQKLEVDGLWGPMTEAGINAVIESKRNEKARVSGQAGSVLGGISAVAVSVSSDLPQALSEVASDVIDIKADLAAVGLSVGGALLAIAICFAGYKLYQRHARKLRMEYTAQVAV